MVGFVWHSPKSDEEIELQYVPPQVEDTEADAGRSLTPSSRCLG